MSVHGKRTISRCRACNATDLHLVVDLGEQPFANALLHRADEAERRYPLALLYCGGCSLVQLSYTADPEELFSSYVWVTGTSATARREAERFCANALARVDGTPRLVVEVASNDGTFLRPFKARGIEVLGVDPARNIADQADADGIPTQCSFFGREVARALHDARGPADIVFARNVIPHVANLASVLEGIAICVGKDGLAIIEVHNGGRILDGLQYDSIYHEHLYYFTLKTLEDRLDEAGLEVVDVDEGPIGGGALVVFARRAGQAASPAVDRYRAREAAGKVNALATWQAFGHAVQRHREELRGLLESSAEAGHRTVGYGASARSSTMLNYCGVTTALVPEIADAAPLKQGLFTAGTRIPIRPPAEVLGRRPDSVLLLAWNFRSEIVDLLRGTYGFRGRVIHPLPHRPEIETI